MKALNGEAEIGRPPSPLMSGSAPRKVKVSTTGSRSSSAGVEPTNNRAERALKEHVVQKNVKCTGSYEAVMTPLASWK